MIVAVEVGEDTVVGVAVLLGGFGVDVRDMSSVAAGAVAFDDCVGCASMPVGWHAISEKTHRSRHHSTGLIILLV